MMLYANLRGRLGNQLFIYAMARALQAQFHCNITFNAALMRKETPAFRIELDQFVLHDGIYFEQSKPLPLYANLGFLPLKAVRKLFPQGTFHMLAKANVFLWLGTTYVAVEPDPAKDIYLDGYWQCPRYFAHIREQLRRELLPKAPIPSRIQAMTAEMEHAESVCVTVRRGDYVSNEKNRKVFYICDPDYFARSIAEIRKRVENPAWYIFSDDIAWAKENFSYLENAHYESGTDSVSEKLYMMAGCKHYIISNSSFSWWAQYLCRNNRGVVVAPDVWYADGQRADLFEEDWTLLPVSGAHMPQAKRGA